ncbi:DUF6059 family protein [Streptomyces sp. TRM68367]|uniref:DUF6059 family protein n=1 Tax=Streptomyces sp. TRM68367 TaxID=2758415 RepID=UPI00165A9873|nr:DUF6059 family protein [Streptomyces sp. TRM68367]MBC9723437.1 hypothetical protein [Streptomyces sp. TRM68367]
MTRLLALWVTRFLGEAYRSLVAYGQMWLYLPGERPGPTPPHLLERVRPDLPLTPAEEALDRQLRDPDSLS